MRNCLIAQSGGPTAAINATLAGILAKNKKAQYFDKAFGARNGIEGVLKQKLLEFDEERTADAFLARLKLTPSMYLGSCRYKIPKEKSDEIYEQIFQTFDTYDIDTFFYIGGNDSMDTVDKLARYGRLHGSRVNVIGLPKTIDNDLVLTDHTPGFGSAAKFVAASMNEICHDAEIYAVKNIVVVEMMGRDSGFLTAASALSKNSAVSGPDLIYVPEVPFSTDSFVEECRHLLTKKDSVVVAVSEGIRNKNGTYISAAGNKLDVFGHAQLMGAGKILEGVLKSRLGIKVKSVELNILQRCAAHLSSKTDLDESFGIGSNAVDAAENKESGKMLAIKRISNSPYKTENVLVDVSRVANQVKYMPAQYLTKDYPYVSESFIEYARPLIMGENLIPYENGIPLYL
ncbi:MAG: 6-phosphofructokinase [Eubacterium sp.]|nr:6-phosphofructokinase [Eubacterium sp.]